MAPAGLVLEMRIAAWGVQQHLLRRTLAEFPDFHRAKIGRDGLLWCGSIAGLRLIVNDCNGLHLTCSSLVMRELDGVLGLSDLASGARNDSRSRT